MSRSRLQVERSPLKNSQLIRCRVSARINEERRAGVETELHKTPNCQGKTGRENLYGRLLSGEAFEVGADTFPNGESPFAGLSRGSMVQIAGTVPVVPDDLWSHIHLPHRAHNPACRKP